MGFFSFKLGVMEIGDSSKSVRSKGFQSFLFSQIDDGTIFITPCFYKSDFDDQSSLKSSMKRNRSKRPTISVHQYQKQKKKKKDLLSALVRRTP
ncbi:hypothetical protein L2E82_05718 [Cichorium intybus]|uniref:Uncharacterized protein n=1 Tax=Cichorium intybus TaxID=13427 RepID=A0ACB9H9K7_CICIN|nr:hypothetical protein L2E82_05718 [Cichorium intybus]